MSEALYERYKDALRRGHVAAMHGRWDGALAAYVEAATIAPERALPHASIGSVYLRSGRPLEALGAFDAALARSPRDEAGLSGRAAALEALRRPADAAMGLDDLAALQEADGRLADACDSARRALSLAESRARRRTVERIVARLREAEADGPRSDALARALQLLDATAVAERGSGAAAAPGTPDAEAPSPPEGPPPVPALAELLELSDRAEAAAAAGDPGTACTLFLEAADGHARAGRPDAALDAAGAAMAVRPADPAPHLALSDLYVERGWRTLAGEKLGLLDRLAELAGDGSTRGAARARLDRLEPAALPSGPSARSAPATTPPLSPEVEPAG